MELKVKRLIPILLLLLTLFALLAGRSTGVSAWRATVDPAVLVAYQEAEEVEFIVVLTEQADLSQARQQTSKLAKGRFTYTTLRDVASATQAGLIAELSNAGLSAGVSFRPFWIVNAIWVRADVDTLRELAWRPDVKHIYGNPHLAFDAPVARDPVFDPAANEAVEWNISLIGAPELWARSIDGRDVVIGGQDTGYEWQHDALKTQYRGWDGQNANHDYNWHDAIHSSEGVCGENSPEPCDDNGHGTHTMGTMVGDDGGSNKIGVAPAARWIGCRNMDGGVGTPASYIECFEWFIAPTRIDGSNPDPSMAPDIINNSWSCPPKEGCDDPAILQTSVEAVRAAGIMTVQSAGNSGSGCATIETPAAIYDASFTVGATSSSDQIAIYSSRGPVMVDDSGRQKPNVAAPGSSIRSSYRFGGYATLSGTSMAAPHVAGLAALLISAAPDLSGQVDRVEAFIQDSAVRKTSSQTCFDLPGDKVPNAVFGHGRIDAVASVRLALAKIRLPMIFKDAPPGSAGLSGVR